MKKYHLIFLLALSITALLNAQEINFENNTGGPRPINQTIGQFSVLQSFDFNFSNGGHKFKAIELRRSNRLTRINFQDNDGNDPYHASANYYSTWRFSPIFGETITGTCRTSCTRQLRPMAGHIPVLQGFMLAFTDGNDHQITEMAISLRPIGIASGRHTLQSILRERNDNRPFRFAAQIVWVPMGNIATANWTISHRGRYVGNPYRPTGVRGDAVLKGFTCRYSHRNGNDDAHYIKQVRFDLGAAHLNRARIAFHDGDADDWRNCSMNYATLR